MTTKDLYVYLDSLCPSKVPVYSLFTYVLGDQRYSILFESIPYTPFSIVLKGEDYPTALYRLKYIAANYNDSQMLERIRKASNRKQYRSYDRVPPVPYGSPYNLNYKGLLCTSNSDFSYNQSLKNIDIIPTKDKNEIIKRLSFEMSLKQSIEGTK